MVFSKGSKHKYVNPAMAARKVEFTIMACPARLKDDSMPNNVLASCGTSEPKVIQFKNTKKANNDNNTATVVFCRKDNPASFPAFFTSALTVCPSPSSITVRFWKKVSGTAKNIT